MKQFEKIEKYPTDLIGRLNSFIITEFDDSMTIEMQIRVLIKWIIKNIDLTNEMVDYLNEFVETFDFKLETTVGDIFTVWLNEGTLSDFVRELISEEVIEARTDYLGREYLTLKERLDLEREEVISLRGAANKFRADIDELDTNKVDKGGASQVTWSMIAQDAREQISGDKVAVVGKDSVTTENYADGSITTPKIADSAVSRDKTNFHKAGYVNIYAPSEYVADEYYDRSTGNVIKKGDANYTTNWGRSKIFPVSGGSKLYRNNKCGSTDTGSCNITYFADADATQYVGGANWTISGESSSVIPPVGANYASMSIHARGINLAIISYEPIKYVDSGLVFSKSQISDIEIPRLTGYLLSEKADQNWEMKLDFSKRELVVYGNSMFLDFKNGFNWVNPRSWTSNENYTFTFDEIGNGSSISFVYVFVRKYSNTNLGTAGKNAFRFLLNAAYNSQDKELLTNWVYLGYFNASTQKVAFEGTRVKVVNSSLPDPEQPKLISILGDSISSFSGWIPSGNTAYYPKNWLNNVDETWWKKLIDGSSGKLELLVNQSWSGSRVTISSGENSAGVNRATKLHSGDVDPEIIIVYLGINDFNHEENVEFGEFDGRTEVPTDNTKFSEAYGMMLNSMTTRYPLAKIYCCTLPFNAKGGFPRARTDGTLLADFNQRIRDISRMFGCDVIELERIGFNPASANLVFGDGGILHPNAIGMQKIYEKVKNKLGTIV